MNLREEDELIFVKLIDGKCDMVIGMKKGMLICFNENDVCLMGCIVIGVKGIIFDLEDEVIGMEIFEE